MSKVFVPLGVMVKPLTVEGVIAPKVKAKAPAVLVAEIPLPVVTELTNVPVVGRVTEVAPVELSVMEFVADVAKVLPAPKVSVPVPVVMVLPLMEAAVNAPEKFPVPTTSRVLAGVTVPKPRR